MPSRCELQAFSEQHLTVLLPKERLTMSNEAAERIHQASLDLLEDPGVRIEHEEIFALLISAGAGRGTDGGVVRIPRPMVEEHLALCPRTVRLADRRGGAIVQSSTSETAFWSCPGMGLYRGGKYELFTRKDMADASRLLDRLEHVDVVFGLAMNDVPPPARGVVGLNVMARNCSKHIRVLSFSPQGARMLREIKPVVGDEAWFSVGFTAHGPLRWTELALEIFRCTAGSGIPVTVNGEPMAGASGPVTLAGSAAVGNAEILAGIVINQLLEPGRACIYNLGLAHTFDMKTAIAVTGGPENALFADLSAVMGRFYSLPSASWVSTESMSPDAQAGLEKMFGFQTHLAAGVTNVWGVGQLESEITFSPAQAVIDNEMIGYVLRHRRGVDVSDDALAVELTRSVGIAGWFLDRTHTLENFRSELFLPELLFRKRRDDWEAGGRATLEQRAEQVADELMKRPPETSLDEHQIRTLDEITDRLLKEA